MTKFNLVNTKIKLISFTFLIMLYLAIALQSVSAKVYTIQNMSVDQFVVNGSSGNIILNPNAGFGNVGIGTTAPLRALHVVGVVSSEAASGSVNFNLRSSTNNADEWQLYLNNEDLRFWEFGATDRVTFQKGGNVGIGTTGPNLLSSSNQKFLTIQNSDTTADVDRGSYLELSNTNDGDGVRVGGISFISTAQSETTAKKEVASIVSGVSGTTASDRGGILRLMTKPDDGSLTERVRIDRNGNVGIGTTSPATVLDVKGKANFTGNFSIMNGSDTIFFVDNTTGKVGIRTASPNATLHIVPGQNIEGIRVGGSENTLGLSLAYTDDATTIASIYNRYAGNAASQIDFGFGRIFGSNVVMTLKQNGNVGIGTTNPGARLEAATDAASGYAGKFFNDGNNVNRLGLRVSAGTDDGSGTSVLVDWEDGDLTLIGQITHSGGTVTYGAFTANHDVSLPEQDNTDGYSYGTLVCVDNAYVTPDAPRGIKYDASKCNNPYSKNVLGAYAGKYDGRPNLHQVYVLGDGHILVNGEGGDVKIGDLITTSSTPGIGMKANEFGLTMGVVQENYTFSTPSETKLIAVQYGLRYGPMDTLASGQWENGGSFSTESNFGSGTTTPTEVLSVNGNVSIEGTNCRDSGGSATCNNFVDIAELFDSSEPVDSGDVVVIDFMESSSMPSARNRLTPSSASNSPQNPQTTSKSFQNPRPGQFQDSVPAEFQNSGPDNFQNPMPENNTDSGSAFKIKKSMQPYDKKVVGIVSTQPAIVIEGGRIVAMGNWKGQNNTMKPAIALAGRVPVKVTDENGHIKKGDLLTTSSKPGYAMKCELKEPNGNNSLQELNLIVFNNERCRSSILGKALEPLENGEGKILMFVSTQ